MSSSSESTQRPDFQPTRWTLVSAARGSGDDASAALDTLCQTYWFPLYAYLRHVGHSQPDAEDIVQSFLAWFCENQHFERVDQERGKLRTFLLAYLKNFTKNYQRKENTERRGGGESHVSIDAEWAENRLVDETQTSENADAWFDRRWARTIMENSLTQLRDHFAKKANVAQFDILRPHLTGDSEEAYGDLATALDTTTSSVKGIVFRARERLRSYLREEVRETLDAPSAQEIDAEITYLMSALSRL